MLISFCYILIMIYFVYFGSEEVFEDVLSGLVGPFRPFRAAILAGEIPPDLEELLTKPFSEEECLGH